MIEIPKTYFLAVGLEGPGGSAQYNHQRWWKGAQAMQRVIDGEPMELSLMVGVDALAYGNFVFTPEEIPTARQISTGVAYLEKHAKQEVQKRIQRIQYRWR